MSFSLGFATLSSLFPTLLSFHCFSLFLASLFPSLLHPNAQRCLVCTDALSSHLSLCLCHHKTKSDLARTFYPNIRTTCIFISHIANKTDRPTFRTAHNGKRKDKRNNGCIDLGLEKSNYCKIKATIARRLPLLCQQRTRQVLHTYFSNYKLS